MPLEGTIQFTAVRHMVAYFAVIVMDSAKT